MQQQDDKQLNKDKEVMKMPAGDKTGPLGLGPMTGRGLGYCAGYSNPGYANPRPRRFFRRGFGWRRWSKKWLYEDLGLFNDYRVVYRGATSADLSI